MNIYAKTDIGLKRQTNQDSFDFGKIGDNCVWAVVCDGMGGSNAGNVASSKTVGLLSKSFSDNLSPKISGDNLENFLKNSIASANAAVFDAATSSEELTGMGTTVVAMVVLNNVAYLAHAGDSRAYILSNGELKQITTDHSIVQTMVDSGQITEEEAKTSPHKNIITRAVGVKNDILVDFNTVDLKSGDKLLICTDGLTNCVDDEEIAKIISNDVNAKEITEKLISAANENGGIDNITATVIII